MEHWWNVPWQGKSALRK